MSRIYADMQFDSECQQIMQFQNPLKSFKGESEVEDHKDPSCTPEGMHFKDNNDIVSAYDIDIDT